MASRKRKYEQKREEKPKILMTMSRSAARRAADSTSGNSVADQFAKKTRSAAPRNSVADLIRSDFDLAFKLQMQEAMNASLALLPSSSAGKKQSKAEMRKMTEPQIHHPKLCDRKRVSMASRKRKYEQKKEEKPKILLTMNRSAAQRAADPNSGKSVADQFPKKTRSAAPRNSVADTIHSDFDLAYKLQMQEAMNASLALLPSSSAGKKQSKAEMRKMTEPQIHHPKLAGGELKKINARKYRIPYISSSFSSSTERFWVYFKILVTEKRVTGIWVAICDSKDNFIFEVRKFFEASMDRVVMSYEVASLQALIEGLNKALILNLKNVSFFCADSILYQYLSGRIRPQASKIANLVNQVALLQRKLINCNPSLVAPYGSKFARDAIVSQTTWSAESSKGRSSKETCVICYEDTDVDKMFSVDGCWHRYCFSCMKKHLEVKLLNGKLGNCPHVGCKSEVNIDTCAKFLDPKLVEVFRQRMKESSIPVTEKIYCPYRRCSALMSKTELLQCNLKYLKPGAKKCVKCHYYFCINCKVAWHYDMTCNDYKRSNPHQEDRKLKSLAREQKWRQCVKCNHMVELAQGCNHITCRCGYEFCYSCGAEWKKKKSCSCPFWDERNILGRNIR